MSQFTNNIQLPKLAGGVGGNVVATDAFIQIDQLFGCVLGIQNTPAVSPAQGDAYIVGTSGTGDWDNHDNAIAYFYENAWRFIEAHVGLKAWVKTQNIEMVYLGTAWQLHTGAYSGTRSTSFSTTSASFVGITLDTDDLEPAVNYVRPYSGNNDQIQCVYGGVYRVEFTAELQSTTNSGQYEFAIAKNGSAVSGSERKIDIASGVYVPLTITKTVSVSAGDYISIFARKISGSGTLAIAAGRNEVRITKLSA